MPSREVLLLALNSPPGLREELRPVLEGAEGRVAAEFYSVAEDLVTRVKAASYVTAVIVPPSQDSAGPIQTALMRGFTVFIAAREWPPGWAEWREAHPGKMRLHLLHLPFSSADRLFFTGLEALESEGSSAELDRRTEELRHCEERFASVFRAAPFPQAILEYATGRIVDANQAFCDVTGFSRAELLEHSLPALNATRLAGALAGQHPMARVTAVCRHKSGEARHLRLSTQPASINGAAHLIVMADDITDRVKLEEQLRQARRMEALGQLASGVAHDFNNLLTVIQGQLSLQLAGPDLDPSVREALRETLVVGEHAAALTGQLLTFNGGAGSGRSALDLNALISRMSALLRRLIGEQIEVRWECAPGLPAVPADAQALEQVIMHLVIAARDAMPLGGRLRIATGLLNVSPRQAAQQARARAGAFVKFSVVDSGAGMDSAELETLRAVFSGAAEVPGAGAAASMSAVAAIVQRHGGWIEIFSEPGQGSAYFVYLPVTDEPAAADTALLPGPLRTGLKVLLVEDEPAVRSILSKLLAHCGCSVLEAGDAPAARVLWEQQRHHIDLLITDIVMPGGMTGHELARLLTDDRPDLRVIYCSGYSAGLYPDGTELVAGRNFLPKPYDAGTVAALIRRVAAERTESLPA